MRWVICALVVLVAPAGARAGDFDVLRGAQPVGYATYTRWSGLYGGGMIGEEFNGADFRNVGASEITTIAGLSAGFDGVPLSNFPRLNSLNNEAPSYSAFLGYNYQFESAVVGFELTFTKTSFSASINDRESHDYFQTANNVVYDATYNVNTSASANPDNNSLKCNMFCATALLCPSSCPSKATRMTGPCAASDIVRPHYACDDDQRTS